MRLVGLGGGADHIYVYIHMSVTSDLLVLKSTDWQKSNLVLKNIEKLYIYIYLLIDEVWWPLTGRLRFNFFLGKCFPQMMWVFPKIMVSPKWMVKIMENPFKMDDLGKPIIFGNTHVDNPNRIYLNHEPISDISPPGMYASHGIQGPGPSHPTIPCRVRLVAIFEYFFGHC